MSEEKKIKALDDDALGAVSGGAGGPVATKKLYKVTASVTNVLSSLEKFRRITGQLKSGDIVRALSDTTYNDSDGTSYLRVETQDGSLAGYVKSGDLQQYVSFAFAGKPV